MVASVDELRSTGDRLRGSSPRYRLFDVFGEKFVHLCTKSGTLYLLLEGKVKC